MSDYLTDDEQVARLRQWWQRNGTVLVVTLVLVAGGVVGWRWYQSYVNEQVTKASELYAEFLAANGAAREALAAEVLASGRSSAYPALVALKQAQEATASGDLEAAAGLLEQAVASASGQPLADLARLRLARVQHALGRDDDALRTIGQVRAPGYLSVAHELKGDIHLARDERAEAHRAYTAALAEVLAEDQRTLLEIKVADTADASDS